MRSRLTVIKKYRRRFGILKGAGQVGASVRAHRREYALLARGVADFLKKKRAH